jgi:uncharacterized protein with FMN-binding domain
MGKYTDGEYTAEGLYGGGKKSIIVKMRLDGGTIKHVEVTPNTPNIKMSFGLQKKFAEAVPEVVVGRPIDEVHLDKLAGSSLTTKGFNDAIEKIKTEAAQ